MQCWTFPGRHLSTPGHRELAAAPMTAIARCFTVVLF